jgi:TonB family protein
MSGQFMFGPRGNKAMSMKLFSATLALLLLVPPLIAGESSPAVKFAVAPKYPTLTLAGRVYGQVTVRVTIDRAGAVKDATVTDGHPMLREAAMDAAQQWKFEESSLPKRVATLKFSFVLLPEDSQVASQTVFLPPMGIEIRQKPAALPALEDEGGEFHLDQHPLSKT